MPQKTDAVIAELMDRRLLNDVDPDLHQEIAKAVVKAVHTASLQGEDAVERVKALAHRFWSIHPSTIAAMNLTREEFYVREMMALLTTGLVPDEAAVRAEPTLAQINSACLSFRHDFGLLDATERGELQWQATEWLRAWQKEGFGCDRDEVIERCAAVVDQCNREGPYEAIASAKRIRALKSAAIRSGGAQ